MGVIVGFHGRASVPVPNCLLLHPDVMAALAAPERDYPRRRLPQG